MDGGGGSGADYRVLARKYRPRTFDDLIGQEALVRTLRNALDRGRLAHAFVLAGVRGVGKTTTARIIAKGLNCVGPDGAGGPTVDPCGACDSCRAIAEDRHVDVLEMDAASRTGVDDIRELIDGARYRPVSARYKVYIVDEVHMLSRNAFNALLKTLEEPPEHAKFVFATTEIRKVPITVLSRCQRFDLRRIGVDDLAGLLARVCGEEAVEAGEEALRTIALAADGSARDALSLLDQAIALADGPLAPGPVRDMLGLADRGEILDLFEDLMRGRLPETLARIREMNELGADPLTVAQDLLEATHLVTRFKAAPGAMRDVSEVERARCAALAGTLGTPHLGRAWQMLLKAVDEVQRAPSPLAALEMAAIRLAHLVDAPAPAGSARPAGAAETVASPPPAAPAPAPPAAPAATRPQDGPPPEDGPPPPAAPEPAAAEAAAAEPAAAELAAPETVAAPGTFEEVVALFEARREPVLAARLARYARPIRLAPGALEIAAGDGVDERLAGDVARRLGDWTGRPWTVALGAGPGEATLVERERAAETATRRAASADPAVAAVLEHFPGASIEAVRPLPGAGAGRDGPEANAAAAEREAPIDGS